MNAQEVTSGVRSFWHPPTWALMDMALAGILWLGLALPVLAVLVMFSSILGVRRFLLLRFPASPPWWATLCCGLLGVLLITLASLGTTSLLDNDTGLPAMADSLTQALIVLQGWVPQNLSSFIPGTSEDLFALAGQWVQKHAGVIPAMGAKLTKMAFHLVIGLLVGGMAAHAYMYRVPSGLELSPHSLTHRMRVHVNRFRIAFEQVVFAQIYIAGTNAIFTGIFLALVMPALGFPIPFVKTLTALTFLLGLIPILGNIISNTLICAVSMTVSPWAAAIALAFLVIIHKLEYFLNAWIMGSRIKVQAYELLAAMLVLEAIFGTWGLVLAPVLYAYLREELRVAEGLSAPIVASTPESTEE